MLELKLKKKNWKSGAIWLSNESIRDRVAKLFKKRTGVVYQNWIQALAVTLKQKKKIICVYSSEDCKVDKDGGPYKVELEWN